MAPAVTVEDNLKLFASYVIFDGNLEAIANYMGITKNAVSKRLKKLTDDERELATKSGHLKDGNPITPQKASPKKRAASEPPAKSAKKVKSEETTIKNENTEAISKDKGENEEADGGVKAE